MRAQRRCVCGHTAEAHQHFRRGSDCGTCGPARCPRFRRVGLWRRPMPPAGGGPSGALEFRALATV